MKIKMLPTRLLILCLLLLVGFTPTPQTHPTIVFATFAEQPSQLSNIILMAESIRTFAGSYHNAPIWLYIADDMNEIDGATQQKLTSLQVELKRSTTPKAATWFLFAKKVFAAAKAEADAEGKAAILAWLDEDTIVLREPDEFILPPDKKLGYRPVMHKNIGSIYHAAVDSFWNRIYAIISVPEAALFPMVTPADGDTIRPYFNAGCLIVRPESNVLRKWVDYFIPLYQDTLLTEMCRRDFRKRIFLHQTALTGAILNHLQRDEIVQLSDRINYPLFFKEMFGAKREFNNIENVVTFRHESYFRNPAPDWADKLQGPPDKIAWIKEHLAKK